MPTPNKSKKTSTQTKLAVAKKATAKKATAKKATAKKAAKKNPITKTGQAPLDSARGRKLTALAVAYARDNASDLYGDFDGKSDMAVDEVITQTLAEHGQDGENEAFIAYARVEAAIEAEFEEIEQDLDDN